MALKMPPYRTWIAMMVLWTTAINYCFRSFFPITLIAIVDKSGTSNDTEIEQPDYGSRYAWSAAGEGQLLGAYFYGYTISSLPGGFISERFGPYWTIIVSTIMSGLLTVISPLLVMESWIPLFILRIIVGLAGGVQYPALQSVIGRWAPPNEKGKFVACLMGNVVGSVFTQSTVGLIISAMENWGWGFYFTGFMTVIFLVGWVLLVSDYPDQNWFCKEEEAQYIHESHQGAVTAGKAKAPVVEMLKSVPFLSFAICQFGSLWGLFLLLTVVPKYMADVLKFNLKSLGFLSSTPGISRFISGCLFGGISDYLLKKQIVSKVFIRKGFILFSHILPGLVLFIYLVIGDNVTLGVTLLIMVMAFNGATVVTNIVNPQDLAPNFAGTQYGIANCFASTTGFIVPAMVGAITKEQSGIKEWALIFGISGVIYILSGVFFICFGSVKLQPWNEKKLVAPPAEGTPTTS